MIGLQRSETQAEELSWYWLDTRALYLQLVLLCSSSKGNMWHCVVEWKWRVTMVLRSNDNISKKLRKHCTGRDDSNDTKSKTIACPHAYDRYCTSGLWEKLRPYSWTLLDISLRYFSKQYQVHILFASQWASQKQQRPPFYPSVKSLLRQKD